MSQASVAAAANRRPTWNAVSSVPDIRRAIKNVRNIQNRLNRLEAGSGIDRSGCAPHSAAWLAYGKREFERYDAREPGAWFTIEAADAIMQNIDDDAE